MEATLTAPTREALALLVGDALSHRIPEVSGCCWQDAMCESHERDGEMAAALRLLLLAVELSDDDGEALRLVRSVAPRVLAEIRGATADGELRAAIGGTGEEK